MVRPFLVLIACVSATALACGGEQQETSGRQATGFEQVEQTTSPDECPPDWPGPWTACPEADWVERVAQRAGYRISGKTGSALIAEGNGRSFYIWTTPAATAKELEKAVSDEDWQPFGSVEGVQVYGDKSVWRWWVGESFTIWLQAGPTKDSRLPSLTEMASLVRASETLPEPSPKSQNP
jgi:hypothetical protein